MRGLTLCAATFYASGCGEDSPEKDRGAAAAFDGGDDQRSEVDGSGDSGAPDRHDGGAAHLTGGTGCEAVCRPQLSAGCKSFSLDACVAACRLYEVDAQTGCSAEFGSFQSCKAGASYTVCQSNGIVPQSEACIQPSAGLVNCLNQHPRICESGPNPTACDTCVAEKCCVEREACGEPCRTYSECARGCSDVACTEACAADMPLGTRTLGSYLKNCKEAECASACAMK